VLSERFVIVCECDVVRFVSRFVAVPYDAVSPYSTWLSAGSFVVHVMVADVVVTLDDWTLEIVGAVMSDSLSSVVDEQSGSFMSMSPSESLSIVSEH